MKIITRKELMALPNGTIFRSVSEIIGVTDRIMVKGDTLEDAQEGNFEFFPLATHLDYVPENDEDFREDLASNLSENWQSNDQRFAVYDAEDAVQLLEAILIATKNVVGADDAVNKHYPMNQLDNVRKAFSRP